MPLFSRKAINWLEKKLFWCFKCKRHVFICLDGGTGNKVVKTGVMQLLTCMAIEYIKHACGNFYFYFYVIYWDEFSKKVVLVSHEQFLFNDHKFEMFKLKSKDDARTVLGVFSLIQYKHQHYPLGKKSKTLYKCASIL